MSKRIQQLTSGKAEADDLLAELIELGAKKILQEALEAEEDEFLGRSWYQHSGSEDLKGYRNGYTPKSFKTRNGRMRVQCPRVRGSIEPFESKLLARLDNMEQSLKTLAVEMYTPGLSTRDIGAILSDKDGELTVTRSEASRMSETLYDEYQLWSTQDLSGYDAVYLFADGVYESVRSISGGQTILCVLGICSDGRKVLLGLEAVVSDGGKGLKAALTKYFPYATQGRCIAHKMRNLMDKLPRDKQVRSPIKRKIKAIYYAPDRTTANQLAVGFIESYAGEHPAMIKCFQADIEACLAHLEFPAGHRRYIRTTNLIERAFVEQKRRTKGIPVYINEKGFMKLIYGSLIRATRDWQKVGMDPLELTQLKHLRKTMVPDDEITTENNNISYQLAA